MKWIEEGMGNKSYVKKTFKILKLKYFYNFYLFLHNLAGYIFYFIYI
jgi:hypothetical protein